MTEQERIHYLRKNFNSETIIKTLVLIALTDNSSNLSEKDHAVLAALRRSTSMLESAMLSEIQDYLKQMDETQISKLVSRVKVILHEIKFIRLENKDGSNALASFFDAAKYPDADIHIIDRYSGEVWIIKLEATRDEGYVADWIENHPEGEIRLTPEFAQYMDLPISEQANTEPMTNVEELVDKMISTDEDDSFWEYFPALGIISISIVIWELWERYQKQEIALSEFQYLVARTTGLKIAKIVFLGFLLSLPVVGQATGAVLVAKLLLNTKENWYDPIWKKHGLQ